jgi:PAS domain-containing protein
MIQSDIGRPISDITSKMAYQDITSDARKVLDTLTVKEQEIQTYEGEWVNMRIMPYRTVDNVIDGVVITFVDITESKKTKDEISRAMKFAESIVATIREPLLVLDAQLRVVSASLSFYRTFQMLPEDTEHQHIYDLGNRQWDIPSLRKLLEETLPEEDVFENYIVEHDFPSIGKRKMVLNARKLYKEGEGEGEGEGGMILLAIEDITGQGHEKE